MADNAQAEEHLPIVYHAENDKANHNIIMGISRNLDDAHINEMIKVVKEKYTPGDTVHVIHVVGEHEGHIRGHASAPAQAKEESEAREFIEKNVEPKLKEKDMTYTVDIKYGSWDVETIGAIISKCAEDLDASLVVLCSTHRNFLEKMFVGSVPKWVKKHTHADVTVIP